MRHMNSWWWLACLLLAACQPADRSLPTLMFLPSATLPVQTADTPISLPTVAPTQERTRLAIVLSATPTPTLTPTELPPLPSFTPPPLQNTDDLLLTLAALTALPPTLNTAAPCSDCFATITSTPPLLTALPTTSIPDTQAVPMGTPIAANVSQPTQTPTATVTVAAWYTQNHTHSREAVTLYDGPGTTYRPVGVLNPDVDVRIVERNRIGNWLHVRQSENGDTRLDGWTLIGPLILDASLRFSQVPVNESLPDASMAQVRFQTTAPLYAAPVIPYISEAMRDVYLRGQRFGIRSQSITKIGDSVSANPFYLDLMSHNDYVLGPYDYLADTLLYFGPSRKQESVAAKKGMSSFSVFDPLMANENCKADESPLVCELRRQKPAVAFIMFGPNDIRAMDVDEYKAQMSLLVEDVLANGTIPVLTTFSADPARRTWQESVAFNLALIEVARTYEIPLMNLWLASRDLPKYGLEGDGIHMRNFGYEYLKFDAGLESHFGVSLQNLLALRTLEEIRNTVMQP